MHREQREQTRALLRKEGIDRALFARPANVTWLTGVPLPWRPGADLYAGGPALVWYEGGIFTLIVVDALAGTAASFAEEADGEVIGYRGYSYTEQPAGADHLAAALRARLTGVEGVLGVEERHLPAFLARVVGDAAPGVMIRPVDGLLDPLRIIRTAEELAKMRENFALIEVAQRAAGEAVRPGSTEMDVWYAIHTALQRAADQVLPLGTDCTVGRRMGGPPQPVEILPDDSFIVDLSTIWRGYWSDSCVTYYAGEPSEKQKRMHRTADEALALAIDLARPGAVAREIDRQVRAYVERAGFPVYPHHTGHGISTIGHDGPRIVPHSDEILAPGMVIMLEPGIYFPGETGVRLEHAVLITDGPAEILTPYGLNVP